MHIFILLLVLILFNPNVMIITREPSGFCPSEVKGRPSENAALIWLLDVRLQGTVSCRKVFRIDKVDVPSRPSRDSLLETIRGHIALPY